MNFLLEYNLDEDRGFVLFNLVSLVLRIMTNKWQVSNKYFLYEWKKKSLGINQTKTGKININI